MNFVVEKNGDDVIREGKVTITAQGITKSVDIVQQTEAMGGVNLLDTPEEDYSFERITTNKYWPALGEWGGSDSQGIGKFGQVPLPSGLLQTRLYLTPDHLIYLYVCVKTKRAVL